MSNFYTQKKIKNILYNAYLIHSDFYTYKVDHDIRLALYDVENAAKKLTKPSHKLVFDYMINNYTRTEIAKELNTYYNKIVRLEEALLEELEKQLNGDE